MYLFLLVLKNDSVLKINSRIDSTAIIKGDRYKKLLSILKYKNK